VLQALSRAKPRLRRAGVRHVWIFGSLARGAARPDSDVDILIELDRIDDMDIFDYAAVLGEISDALPALEVDVAERNHLKPHVRGSALRDEIRVF
jgi:predicted nucleotidyltransferase